MEINLYYYETKKNNKASIRYMRADVKVPDFWTIEILVNALDVRGVSKVFRCRNAPPLRIKIEQAT